VEKSQSFVVLNLQNVAVSADEKLGRTGIDNVANARIVFARVSSDVSHQYVCSLAGPSEFLGKETMQVTSIDVSMYGSQRTEFP